MESQTAAVRKPSQPKKYTSYERDANGSDDAMHRRYSRSHSRFDQPDPYDGSYSLTNPQSFNRYAYVGNDPVNFVDPSGLCPAGTEAQPDARGDMQCVGVGGHSVTINIPGGGRSGGVGGTSSGPMVIVDPSPDGPTGDPGGGGPGPQTTPSSNPNCLQNAVVGSPGVGRGFDANPGPNGRVFHDGAHALSPANAANAITLRPLAGRVMASYGQGDGLRSVVVRPTSGNFLVVYKDLASVAVTVGQTLGVGDVVVAVRPAGDPRNYVGLHVTLLRAEYYGAFRRELQRAARAGELGGRNTRNMFIDPLAPGSPINCRP